MSSRFLIVGVSSARPSMTDPLGLHSPTRHHRSAWPLVPLFIDDPALTGHLTRPARYLFLFRRSPPWLFPMRKLLNIPTQTARPVRRLAALTRRIRSDTYPTFKRAAPVVLVSRYSLVRVVRSSSHQSLGPFTTTLKLCPPGTNPGIVRGGLASILARRPSPVQLKKPYKSAPPRRRSAAGATGSDRGCKLFIWLSG